MDLHDILILLKLIVSLSIRKNNIEWTKTLRHFPLIPRLRMLLTFSKTADSLRCHEEEHSKYGKLRHQADCLAWKYYDRLHPDFALDCRNVRLGYSNDGLNPF